MDDRSLMATCIADEAGNQPHEGKVAVGEVIKNRMALKFFSDGTVEGTVLHFLQFSGFWCDFVEGKYTQVAHTQAEAMARAEKKLETYSASPGLWSDCLLAVDQAMGKVEFSGGPEFQKITPHTVLYLNPAVVHPLPAWATPDKMDSVLYSHTFYHA